MLPTFGVASSTILVTAKSALVTYIDSSKSSPTVVKSTSFPEAAVTTLLILFPASPLLTEALIVIVAEPPNGKLPIDQIPEVNEFTVPPVAV